MSALNKAVADASRSLSSARLSEADALGRVNVAQANYSAAQKKYAADSPQVVRTFESLSSAQRRYSAAQDVTTAATGRLKGAQAQLSSALGQIEKQPGRISQGFSNLGASIQDGFGDLARGAVQLVGGAITSVVGLATAGAVAVTAALAGVVSAGFSRLSTVETAQAKLKALGNTSADVAEIMKNANDSVIGTQYSLADAVTAAASAVAAGIKPGQQLTDYLKLNANAAAVAGVSFSDLSLVMNQVRSQGKAYTQDLNQVASRGIPIWQGLQEVYGVTRDKLTDMVQKGEIDADHFEAALRLKVGNAADEIGKTTTGSFENMKAAISRFGAALVGPVFPLAEKIFTGITKALDNLKVGIQPLVDKYGPKISDAFDNIVARAAPFFSEFVQKIIDWANSPAGAEFFSEVGDNLDDIGNAMIDALPTVIEFTKQSLKLVGALVKLGTEAAPAWIHGAAQIGDFAGLVNKNLATAVDSIDDGTFWQKVGDKFANGGKQIGDFFTTWWTNITSGGGLENGANQIGDFFAQSWDSWGEKFQNGRDQINDFFYTWWDNITTGGGLQNGADQIGTFFSDSWTSWGEKFQNGRDQINTGISDWWNGLMASFANGGNQIGSFVSTAWANITGSFSNGWNQITSGVAGAWANITGAFANGARQIGGFFSGLYNTVAKAIGDAGSWLYNTGKDIIQGLINGVSSMINNAVNAVKNVGGQMLDGIKSFLGIHSPSRVFADEVGKNIGLGIIKGVNSTAGQVSDAVTGLVPAQISSSSSAGSSSGSQVYATGGAPLIGTVVAPDQNPVVSGRIIGEEVARLTRGLRI